jgi:replicative DNA helicase
MVSPNVLGAAQELIHEIESERTDNQIAWPTLVPPRRASVRASSLVGDIRDKSTVPTVTTGWPLFDLATGGLELGSITLAVGFQGSGKSSWAAQVGAHHAQHAPCVYYLGEMSPRMLAARIIGQRTGRAWQDVLRGKLTDAEMHAVLDPLHLYIVPRSTDPVAAIGAAVAEARASGVPGPIMLVIDYVQLLADVGADMRVQTAATVRALQKLVEDQDLVSVWLSQTSRTNSKRIREGTDDSIDLADTGAETAELERSATVQLTLSYQPKDDTRVHDVIVAVGKRRFGGPTKLYFRYDGETGVWSESAVAVRSNAELQLEADILEQVRVHEQHRCNSGAPCGYEMSRNTLSKSGGPHHVGSKDRVSRALAELVKAGRLRQDGNGYRPVTP